MLGNFERMVRIADGTGIPLDGPVVAASNDFREELGLDELRTRRQEELGWIGGIAAPILRGAVTLGLRAAGWRSRRG